MCCECCKDPMNKPCTNHQQQIMAITTETLKNAFEAAMKAGADPDEFIEELEKIGMRIAQHHGIIMISNENDRVN